MNFVSDPRLLTFTCRVSFLASATRVKAKFVLQFLFQDAQIHVGVFPLSGRKFRISQISKVLVYCTSALACQYPLIHFTYKDLQTCSERLVVMEVLPGSGDPQSGH